MELAKANNGLVHVLSPGGGGEYTFCGLEIQEGGGDPGIKANHNKDLSLKVVTGGLPNCKECKEAIQHIREAIKGVRFSDMLRSIDDAEQENERNNTK